VAGKSHLVSGDPRLRTPSPTPSSQGRRRRNGPNRLNGGSWSLVGEFVEVESGKRADRPKLAEAIKACRVRGAKLVIAKLDRLARNVAFISNLMESGVEFEALDFPQANRLTIHIMAAMAEHEAKMISDRTKDKGRRRVTGRVQGPSARRVARIHQIAPVDSAESRRGIKRAGAFPTMRTQPRWQR
jgi:DNA invertase Pin-like site-specific DNA recombinase